MGQRAQVLGPLSLIKTEYGSKMNYEEARVYLDEIAGYGSVLGLSNMRELAERLGNPQNQLKFVHIAGTNGKGSVLAYVSSVLTEAGYRVGRYISPVVSSYEEKIQVDGIPIDKADLAELVTQIARAADAQKREKAGTPTVFEVETVLAFLYFKKKNCDVVVLETGLGGTDDATNIIENTDVCVITSVSMDHGSVLGNTLTEIAEKKAGIIKPGAKVVTAPQDEAVMNVIREKCFREGCHLTAVDTDSIERIYAGLDGQRFRYRGEEFEISLAGTYQVENACTAIEVLKALRGRGYKISNEAVYRGFVNAKWPYRFTVINQKPAVILDGAHNPAGAKALAESVKQYLAGKKVRYVFGVFADKDYEKIIELTAPFAEEIVCVETPGNPRALPAKKLADAVRKVNPRAKAADSIGAAVRRVMEASEDDDAVVIFGSLSFLVEAEREVKSYGRQ